MKEWNLPSHCDCDHCKGGKNKHAWAFYYYMLRLGDDLGLYTDRNCIIIRNFSL